MPQGLCLCAEISKNDENATRILEKRRALLGRCRYEGIDAAFADRSGAPAAVEAVLAFVYAQSWAEKKQIVEAHRNVLLTDDADEFMAYLLAQQYSNDEGATHILEEHRTLLLRCRHEGIDAAFADLVAPGEPSTAVPEPVVETVLAFVNAQTWAERKQIVEASPDVLLTDAADEVLANLLAQYKEDENVTRVLEKRRRLLLRCRREGIDAAFELGALWEELQRLTEPSDMPRAITLCRAALELISRDSQQESWAALQGQLGNSLYRNPLEDRAENLERAIEHYRQALKVYTREKFPQDWAMTQYALGNAYRDRIREDRVENLERAIEHCRQALKVITREKFPEQWAMTQNILGNAYSQRIREDRAENLERAIEHYRQALKVRTHEKFPEQWAATQNNLGIAYSERIREERAQNIEEAIEHFELALKVYTREKFPEQWATTQNNLGNAYRDRIREDRAENLERAIEHYRQALKVRTREKFPQDWAMTQNILGAAYSDRIREDRAENLERAIEHYRQALKVYTREKFPEGWARIQNNLGTPYRNRILGERAQNLEDAIEHYELALEVRTPTTFPQDCRDTAYSLGNLLYNERRFAEARTQFTTAHDAVEALRGEIQREGARRDLAEQNALLYARLVHCCLLGRDEEAAFKYAVAGKGRAFVDMLATARFDLSAAGADDPELAEDLRKARELRQQIDNLWTQLRGEGGPSTPDGTERRSRVDMRDDHRALQDREDTLWNEMAYKHPSLTATQQAPALTAREARKLAGKLGATLVEYYRHEDGWSAFVVNPDGMRHVPLPGVDDELLGLMFRWLGRIELSAGHEIKKSHERSSRWLRRLHEAFIAPLRSYLPKEGKVVLAPFAHLHLLPLGAALNPESGRYAIDDYGLAFAPNLAALRVALDQVSRTDAAPIDEQKPERLLSVAYPGSDPKSKDYLENVVPEAEAAAHRFFPWATPLYEDAATPGAVLANARGQDVVHLGCHGTFDPEAPGRSGLMLSGGWLTVQRIINELRLDRTKLAIIAACLSGRIGLRHGEEHVGLVQAMMSAKARAVVASQWQVDDAATRALFVAFYAGIKAGNSPADALSTAAREVRSKPGWEHPYYWAAFQVSGLAHGANGSGSAQLPDDAESGIEEAYQDSIQRTRGGSTMDATIVVKNSLALLEHMDEDLDEIRATLDPAERDRMVARLRELDELAAGVQTADELLALARAVHRFVQETPALVDYQLKEVDIKAVERSRFEKEDLEESPEEEYVRENVTGIRNHLREFRWSLEEPQESNNDN